MPWIFGSRKTNIAVKVDTQYGHRGATTYGNIYNYNQVPPDKTMTFTGSMLTKTEIDSLITAAETPWSEAGSTVTLPVQGVNWSGKIRSLSADELMGADDLGEAEITLDRPVATE